MSEENVEIVRRAVTALNERDIDGYLACCAQDVQLFLPNSQIDGAYEGPAGVRRFLADVQDAGPDFRLEVEHLESFTPELVLASLRATASGRTTGIDTDLQITNVYELAYGKIRRVRVYRDREEALEATGLREYAVPHGPVPPSVPFGIAVIVVMLVGLTLDVIGLAIVAVIAAAVVAYIALTWKTRARGGSG
jgi:ketosteroid isomerase-like protein